MPSGLADGKLQAEDAAARYHSLRRQRLEISWRLVFGLDVQHMVSCCEALNSTASAAFALTGRQQLSWLR